MIRLFRYFALSLVLAFLAGGPALADTTITVDGDLSDWPADAFDFLDPTGDTLPWRDIEHVWATDDNSSGSDGNLYLAIQFRSNFRPGMMGIDIDVYIYLDVDGDGQISGPADRVIEATEGAVTDGDGNPVGSIGAMAYDQDAMELSIPYSVLGLSNGSDTFGLATRTTGLPGLDDQSPDAGAGDNGFIVYDGTQEPEPRSVLMAELSARAERRGVRVYWSTGAERGNAGFVVFRRNVDGRLLRLTTKPIPAIGSSPLGDNYSFFDSAGQAGDSYFVQDLEIGGRHRLHGPATAAFDSFVPAPIRPPVVKAPVGTKSRLRPMVREPAAAVKFAVRAKGLGYLSMDDLEAGGLSPSEIKAHGLSLLRHGSQVALFKKSGGFAFVGEPVRDRYADYEVLVARPGPGSRMPQRRVRGCTNTIRVSNEHLDLFENHVYYLAPPGEDPFYWAQAYEGTPAELSFDLPGMKGDPENLALELAGMADSHHLAIDLNGRRLDEIAYDGRQIERVEIDLPPGIMREQGNLLEVSVLPGQDVDLVFVAGISLDYQRRLLATSGQISFSARPGACLQIDGLGAGGVTLLDVSFPEHPVRLTGFDSTPGIIRFADSLPALGRKTTRRYLVVATDAPLPRPSCLGALTSRDLSSPALGTDYLVITHPAFRTAADHLAMFQAGRGLASLVVTTGEIYDHFGDGRPAPGPIRELIQTAVSNWSSTPRFVLLLGGSTVDSNSVLPGSPPDFVPAPFVRTARGYEAASDGWYVDDSAAIGRLAVADQAQAVALVDKIIGAYGQSGQPDDSFLFVADDYDPYSSDPSTEFEQEANGIIEACLPAGIEARRMFKSQSADPVGELRADIELGPDAVSYMGHAYLSGWSSGPVLLNTTTAAELSNARPFLLLSFTCFDGAFVGPWADSLAWALVRNPSGGAYLATAASSLSEPEALRRVAGQLVCRLTSQTALTIGETLMQVKLDLAGISRATDDLLATYNLLGDPAMPNPWVTP
ncbi:MAG TPA: C25 family cysteine peptidase [Myxococcota bacterium]|nr:C25 family cysteine peptidase [Myxococcota bacterium]